MAKGVPVSESEVARMAGELAGLADPFRDRRRDAVIPGDRADLRKQLIDAWLDGEVLEPADRLRMALAISVAPGSVPRPFRCGIGSDPEPVTLGQLDLAYRSQSARLRRPRERRRTG
jgi:hypothetical protein